LIKQFNGLNIQVYGTYEEPLFKAKDIGDLLGIKNIKDTINGMDDQCKILKKAPVGNTDRCLEQLFLTEDGLYELLFISRKPIAKQFKVWVRNIIKEIRLNGKYDLEEKLKEHQQLLQVTQQELIKYKEKTYEEIEKSGHVYIIRTDGGYKVGKTKDINNRVKGLQTGNVKQIETILDFKTSNSDLLEKIVHYILDRYRCNSNREFFDCNIDYIKSIVAIAGSTIDTLKSTYHHISNDELIKKLNNRVGIKINDDLPEYDHNCYNFYSWLEENIMYKENELLQLGETCQFYLNVLNVHSSVSSKYKKELERYIKEKYSNIKWEYGVVKINDVTYNGWKHLCIKS
jgi:prophage antirepressor-like protein